MYIYTQYCLHVGCHANHVDGSIRQTDSVSDETRQLKRGFPIVYGVLLAAVGDSPDDVVRRVSVRRCIICSGISCCGGSPGSAPSPFYPKRRVHAHHHLFRTNSVCCPLRDLGGSQHLQHFSLKCSGLLPGLQYLTSTDLPLGTVFPSREGL